MAIFAPTGWSKFHDELKIYCGYYRCLDQDVLGFQHKSFSSTPLHKPFVHFFILLLPFLFEGVCSVSCSQRKRGVPLSIRIIRLEAIAINSKAYAFFPSWSMTEVVRFVLVLALCAVRAIIYRSFSAVDAPLAPAFNLSATILSPVWLLLLSFCLD